MPYISQAAREKLKSQTPGNVGELTYLLTRVSLDAKPGDLNHRLLLDICRQYVDARDKTYQVLAEVLGALAAVRLEAHRRLNVRGTAPQKQALAYRIEWAARAATQDFYDHVVAPYEDSKIAINGDVF